MSFTVTYNNITDKSVGVHAVTRPSVPAPVRDVNVSRIAGRDSAYYDDVGTVADIAIKIVFGFTKSPDTWTTQYRALKKWLLSGSDGAYLKFSDDTGYHYKVHNVEITETERMSRMIGQVEAVFYCDGYTYLDSGDTQINLAATIANNYALCHPLYKITGNGACTLTVNSKTFVISAVSTGVDIDTDAMLSIGSNSVWVNTGVTGDYEDLYLKPGNNSLSITSGFTCKIVPRWRCL